MIFFLVIRKVFTGPCQSFFWYDTNYRFVICTLHRLCGVVSVIPKKGDPPINPSFGMTTTKTLRCVLARYDSYYRHNLIHSYNIWSTGRRLASRVKTCNKTFKDAHLNQDCGLGPARWSQKCYLMLTENPPSDFHVTLKKIHRWRKVDRKCTRIYKHIEVQCHVFCSQGLPANSHFVYGHSDVHFQKLLSLKFSFLFFFFFWKFYNYQSTLLNLLSMTLM